MSISPDIHILTTDELAQKEHLAYMRGVERGKFEASADRNASNGGACEQKMPFKELLSQEAPRSQSCDPSYEAAYGVAKEFLYGPGRSPGTVEISDLAKRFRDFALKWAGKAADGGDPVAPTGEAVNIPAEVVDAVRRHGRGRASVSEVILVVGKLILSERRAAVREERERILKTLDL